MSGFFQSLPASAILILVGLLLVACCHVSEPKFFGGTFDPPKWLKWLLHIIGLLMLLVALATLAKELIQNGKEKTDIKGPPPTDLPPPTPIPDQKETATAVTTASAIPAPTSSSNAVRAIPAAKPSGPNAPKPTAPDRQQVVGGDACLSPNGDVKVGGNLDMSGCNKEPTK